MAREFYDVNEFWAAVEVEIEKSKERTMKCVLCDSPTRERAVGMLPGAPARPLIFAACELCQSQPEWSEEAQRVLSNFINGDDEDEDETFNDPYSGV